MNNLEQEININLPNKIKKINELYQIFIEIIFPILKYFIDDHKKINTILPNDNIEEQIDEATSEQVEININKYMNYPLTKASLNYYKSQLNSKYDEFLKFNEEYDIDIIYFLSDYTNTTKENKIKMYENIKIYLFSHNIYEHFFDYFTFINEFINKFINSKYILNPNINLKSIPIGVKIDNKTKNINDLILYINKLIKSIDNINLERKLIKLDFNKCEKCNAVMSVQKNTSELYCNKCGQIKILTGIVFEDSHFYSQEGNRYKHGSYNPIRHCKSWLENIQAKETIEIKPEIINNIKNKIKRDKIINIENVSYNEYRTYLKDLKYTKYNNYIPLIRKQISGVTPFQLSNDEELLIIKYFELCIKTFNDIKTKEKKNIIQYGFLIYKLIELLIMDIKKKQSLLSSIHLQEPSTLFENDKYWKQICKINKFTYYPTDKNKYL